MQGNPTVIYRARTAQEAHLLRIKLVEAGIEALVTNDVLDHGAGVDLLGWPTDARVVVDERDAEAARQIALYFDQTVGGNPSQAETESTEPELQPNPAQWPTCPQCAKRRTTSCPGCGTSGTEFPLGDAPPRSADDEVPAGPFLICPTCDEPFVPGYLPRCEWCGHAFEEAGETQPPDASAEEGLNGRMVVVVAVLIALFAGTAAYLAWLFRR